MGKVGRPPSNIDPEEIRRMAAIGCTYEEIAQKFKVSRQTIELNHAIEYQSGRVELKETIREAQLRSGKENKGNAGMLIWLGKVYLNQREVTHEERISELDALLKHLDIKAECLNLAKSNSEAIEMQQQD